MKKQFLLLTAAVATLFSLVGTANTASAKSKSAKILSTRTLKKTSYHAVSGYLYTSAHLTKKAHNADNYPLTVFYATKSDTVRRPNGNKAVYYYVKNGNGKVKGWIWRGHLVKSVNTRNQLNQLNQLITLINSTTTKTHNDIVSLLTTINNDTTISDLITKLTNLKNQLNNSADIAKIEAMIQIIQTDFSNGINTLSNLVSTLHTVNSNANTLINALLSRLTSN